jgi:uncharacterized protein YcgI (DUF1989 family)
MKVLSETIVRATAETFVVKKGQIIRVIGESTADYVVFNLRNVKERFDQARTKVDQGKIYVTTGDVLISKYNNVMQTIVKDTYRGTHDMEKGMCSTSFYKKWGDEIFKIYGGVWKRLGRKKVVAPKHGCWENLAKALKPHGVPKEDVPSPLNIFQTMVINGRTGTMRYAMTRPRPGGDMMDLRSEMDCLVESALVGGAGEGSQNSNLQELRFQLFQTFH